MLSSIHVTGFKSLSDFHLDIRPGLNVLIGPNGAGKTNILKFFEFLSTLTEMPLAEAISKLGGAGEIFKRKGRQAFEDRISFKISGSGDGSRYIYSDREKFAFISYELEADIVLSKDLNALYFDRQAVRIFVTDTRNPKPARTPWHFEFHFQASAEGGTIELTDYDQAKLKNFFRFNKQQFADFIKEIQKNTATFRENLIIAPLAQIGPPLWKISSDISSGKAYNIQPEKVRQAEDIAQPPTINPDGSGFAATLYALKSPQTNQSGSFWFYSSHYNRRRYPVDSFIRVQSYSRLWVPACAGTTGGKVAHEAAQDHRAHIFVWNFAVTAESIPRISGNGGNAAT